MHKEKTIAVVAADLQEQQELCRVLERNHYRTTRSETTSGLVSHIRESLCDALILDLDSVPVDNRFIRKLSRENPELCIIGISSRTFHPELEEAMRAHISACLSKPVDEDELLFWLKSISAGEPRSRASP
ncbi:MAG: response regulator [Syntrophobacteraceae bacterium]|jgi:DNA-binding NtrC family response regulator|nr:response regulator [Syntrophobacteraceae bacterium]